MCCCRSWSAQTSSSAPSCHSTAAEHSSALCVPLLHTLLQLCSLVCSVGCRVVTRVPCFPACSAAVKHCTLVPVTFVGSCGTCVMSVCCHNCLLSPSCTSCTAKSHAHCSSGTFEALVWSRWLPAPCALSFYICKMSLWLLHPTSTKCDWECNRFMLLQSAPWDTWRDKVRCGMCKVAGASCGSRKASLNEVQADERCAFTQQEAT